MTVEDTSTPFIVDLGSIRWRRLSRRPLPQPIDSVNDPDGAGSRIEWMDWRILVESDKQHWGR